ncbi:MAG TPA: hypothetical protein VNJ08_13755 [Bacteriovoracaceae bacterium]|nr:hypothetical protein [Bacteriovoracaceae bacterium]
MKILWLLLFPVLVFADTAPTDEKIVGIYYYNPMFGHVHQSSVRTSASLTTIQCSHPVKVVESSKVSAGPEWAYVHVADYKGFILKEFLSEKRPECFQGKYSKFFDAMNLDLAELYYWGRLYDQYIQGETRIQ